MNAKDKSNCVGVFGWLFGHNFRAMSIYYGNSSCILELPLRESDIAGTITVGKPRNSQKHVDLESFICTRCGAFTSQSILRDS